jgi:hypothetical protein
MAGQAVRASRGQAMRAQKNCAPTFLAISLLLFTLYFLLFTPYFLLFTFYSQASGLLEVGVVGAFGGDGGVWAVAGE